jgi:2-polyprenyl-3-methyl-5-hydroxy-6-metoxy-1,4-benzoquinol methylase
MSTVESTGFSCRICGSNKGRWAAEYHGLRVARCVDCGHGYVWPVPSTDFLSSIYRDDDYYQGGRDSIGFTDYASLEPARRRMFSRHLARIESETRVGRVLDVGCANGDFLKVARSRGWQVLGADPSVARAQVEAAGIQLVGTTVQDADVEEGSLDAITFWDVLEHVTDPVADLTRARKLLKPQGVLALTVPDSSNTLARVSGRRWFGYKTAGEHLQFFTGESLAKAFAKAGLTLRVRHATAWSCTAGFLADRAGLYLGAPGRAARAMVARSRLASVVVDMPQINQFALGVNTQVPATVAQGVTP